jgi:hypothetical protein
VDSTTQILTVLILLAAMVVIVVVAQFIRRRRDIVTLRTIPAYHTLPTMVGEAVEANRPMHVSLGNVGLGGSSTVLALASAELFYQVAERAAIGGIAPILTVSDTSAIPLGQDMLRRAYASRGLIKRYQSDSVRWYPGGGHSLAFASALTATLGDDRVSSSVLAGSFGIELALVADAAARRNQGVIATSGQLEGQAVAYVMSDQPLVGEEVFVAGGYLGGTTTQVASVVALDVMRWLLIFLITVPVVITIGDTALSGRFSQAIARVISLLQGGG